MDNFDTNATTLGDPIDIALEKFKDQQSVKIIKENVSNESLFHFIEISMPEMTKQLSSLNSKKGAAISQL